MPTRSVPALVRLGAWVSFALTAWTQPATITGRVFDVYHRPVRSARVATMDLKVVAGQQRVLAGTQVLVDDAGMYRLSVPAGRYILAVIPPLNPVDFATLFPAYFQDTVEFAKAQPVEVHAGEVRPFTDFLLLDVESHRLSGQVTGIPKRSGGVAAVVLSATAGYTDPLYLAATDPSGQFLFDHVPAGSYDLKAIGPILRIDGMDVIWKGAKSGRAHVDVDKPETTGIQIHLQTVAR